MSKKQLWTGHQECKAAALGGVDSAGGCWTAKKFVMAAPEDGGVVRIPALREKVGGGVREMEENSDKARMFHKAFFYRKPANSNLPAGHQYSPAAFK